MPIELEGLVDKTAGTLATSFEKLLLTTLRTLLACQQEQDNSHRRQDGGHMRQDGSHRRRTEVWFVHRHE